MEEIFTTFTDFTLAMMKMAFERGIRCEGVWIFSDLCYSGGMLFSPQFYRGYLMKHLKRYAEFAHERGMDFLFHCDGDVRAFIPLLIETGIDCIHPLEARQGNDVRELKRTYRDKIAFIGNINVDVLSRSKEEIEPEVISKIEGAKEGGGYIFHSDHSIPPMISFANYSYAVELARRHGCYD